MDIELVERLMKAMRENSVFIVKAGDLHVEMSQYAFAPKLPALPVNPPIPRQDDINDYPLDQRAPFQALNPMAAIAAAMGGKPAPEPEPQSRIDPTDPNAPIDDEALFGSNLPQPQ